MSTDQYHLSQDKLVISDCELMIELTLPFHLPRLPEDMQGQDVVQEKEGDGPVRSVYLVSEGRRHGECRLFSEEGKVRAEMFYLHGKLHGPSVMYSDHGQLLSKTWYCDGKRIGKAHFYSTAGALVSL